jgi:ribosome-associated toxin RatA of RatAB toxin-antitoxin module
LFVWLTLFAGVAMAQGQAQQVSVSVLVQIPRAQAWEKLRDFSVAHNYVPGLVRTEIVSHRREGIGAHRRVYDEGGDFLEETVIEWQDGQGFVIKLHDGDEPMMPFERAEFAYRIEAQGKEQTRIELSLTYQMPWGAIGETLADWFIRPVMEDKLVQVAAGIKYYYETGRPATDEDRERLAGTVQVAPAGE